MIKKLTANALFALFVGIGSGFSVAEDIDIFSQNTTVTTDAPNVLIIMDNTANWSQSFGSDTKFAAEKTALSTVVNALKTQFNLGIMMFTETGGSNTGSDGGYVRFAIQGMTDSIGGATAARNCLLRMVGGSAGCSSANVNYSNLDINNDKSNGGKAGVAMGEAYRYFKGIDAYAGNNKVKADPLAFLNGTIAGPQYKTPVSSSCQKNFVIIISNGPFSDNSSDTSTAMTQLGTVNGDTAIISPPDTSSNNNAADEWVRFLYKSSVNAVTYTLEVGPSTTGQGPYNTSLLQSVGRQGKGGYYSAVNSATLLDALNRIFNDINAQNSVFASSSLPLSADNSGAFLNQIYMGVFRPDAQGRPRWLGNLKQYQFALDANDNLFIADVTGAAAASASTGFAQPDAVSFWTSINDYYPTANTPITLPATPYTSAPDSASTYTSNPGTGGFWFFDNKGSGGSYDLADGEFVEKGGAAQQLRLAYLGYGTDGAGTARGSIGSSSNTGRKVFTCLDTCLTPTLPTDTTLLGVAGTALLGTAASNTTFDISNSLITNTQLGVVNTSVTSIVSAASQSVTSLAAGSAVSISAISKTGNVGSVTTSVAHGFSTGDSVVITDAGNPLNGTYSITVTDTTHFTFVASNGNSSGTSGTATKQSTTVTATVSTHGFIAGQRITIAGATPSEFNGVYTVATVVNANSFTYTLSSALGATATGTITATSNTATATATAHGLTDGASVTITGATPSGYNGVYIVRVIDANSFTYSYLTSAPLAAASGTITASIGGGRTTLINWVRGMDTQDENGDTRTSDVRASIHGDVLHSRPLVLNYNQDANSNNVYLFYGGNDGVFRAVKGGQASTDGIEKWAFIPQEFFGKFKRLYDNSPAVLYSSTPSGLTPAPIARDYFWDGPVGSYVERDTSGAITKAFIYLAVRRGGRFIYALNVTDPNAPKFLWKKGCTSQTDDTTCDAGFAELGQTWSQPQVIKVAASANPVLIFGAGYDAVSEDAEPPASTDTRGRGVFVLDAFTGAKIWSAGNSSNSPDVSVTGMNFSIAADVLPIDRNFDGYIDRVYAADVGGNVWRFDIGNANTANWAVSKIASVGDRGATASSRKFLFSMDMVPGSSFDAIVIGSGDREHPLASNVANSVRNRVYMFKDTNTGTSGAALGIFDSCGSTVDTTPSTGCTNLFDATSSSLVPDSALGWLITLADGEKVINSPLIAAGQMFFGTNQPDTSNTTCNANLGIARRYAISYLTGAGGTYTDANGNSVRSELVTGGGFPPSPVSGVVEIGGKKVVFVTDGFAPPPPVKISVPTKRFRTYWHQKID